MPTKFHVFHPRVVVVVVGVLDPYNKRREISHHLLLGCSFLEFQERCAPKQRDKGHESKMNEKKNKKWKRQLDTEYVSVPRMAERHINK